MCSRAKARQVPPSASKVRPLSVLIPSALASESLTSFSVFFLLVPARSCKVSAPSGRVMPSPKRSPITSISSKEPPPISPTKPLGFWMPEITPKADSSASRRPEINCTGRRVTSLQAFRNSSPLDASRAAAVAITVRSLICMISDSTRNRRKAAKALSIASSASLPVVFTPRPKPHKAFSLKIADGARVSPS